VNKPILKSLPRACVVLALIAGSAIAQAQTSTKAATTAKPLAESLKGAARDAYSSATLLLNNEDYAGALTKYEQAYDLSKDARLLYNMAICEKSLRRYARMQKLLRQYEHEEGPQISAEDKATVDAALAAVDKLVGSVTLTVSEGGATVTVDGEVLGTTPVQPLVLDLGPHKLVVTKPGFETIESTIRVEGGASAPSVLTLTLAPDVHPGHLVVGAAAEATVWIDDTVVGKGRFDGPLAPGTHGLRVTQAGKQVYDAHIELKSGETRTVDVTFSEHRALVWPWLAGGGALVAAGVAIGSYLLLKPSDTVTGVPPGKFGSVTFASVRGGLRP
jgi:hypothetical protein